MRILAWLGVAAAAASVGMGCNNRWGLGPHDGSGGGSGGGTETTCPCCDFGCEDVGTPPPVHPVFNPTVSASDAPPPISGGTLIVSHDGVTAVAGDPDRDAVYVVDVAAGMVRATIALLAGDEPGRLVEDAAGRVHVALRGGGALVTIDPVAGVVTARRPVCPAPRGVAYDPAADAVWVACATGELASFPAAGGDATTSIVVERDLRDVVIQDGAVTLTTFRTAEVLRLDAAGAITRRDKMRPALPEKTPNVAWRAVGAPDGTIVVAHQQAAKLSIPTTSPGGYGLGTPIVDSVVAVLRPDGSTRSHDVLFGNVLPVDVAISPDGNHLAVVAAGNAFLGGQQNVFYLAPGGVQDVIASPSGQPIAVAFDAAGDVLVQVREPASLAVIHPGDPPRMIDLSSVSRDDTGHDIFHTTAGAPIACASCHPEGGDDGHVWRLDGRRRRTPSLRGTVAGTAPYHWKGDQRDFHSLVSDVYTGRMSGAFLAEDQTAALKRWVRAIPAPPAPSWLDATSVARGATIFARPHVGCAGCHAGEKLTNNGTVDVGTGSAFQVPPLVGVGWRTPLLHDGCAATIADRFGKCATPGHGDITTLSTADLVDLGAYLESL